MSKNTVRWLVDEHVIYIDFHEVTLENLNNIIESVGQMIDQSPRPLVHTIWDSRNLKTFPKKIHRLMPIMKPLLSNEKLGWWLPIIENPLIKFLSQVTISSSKIRYRAFTNMEELLEFLQYSDSTLPTLSNPDDQRERIV